MILTFEQREQIRKILQDTSAAIAISTFGYTPSESELKRLADEGYITEERFLQLIDSATKAGILDGSLPVQQAFEHAKDQETRRLTYDQLRGRDIPLSDAEKRAATLAVERAGEYCRGLGNKWSERFQTFIVNADNQLAQATRAIIRDKTKVAFEERKTRGQLRTDLRQATQDWTRDWDRIAHTEMQNAYQEGIYESAVERHGDEALMAKVPDPQACPSCKRLYLDDEGKPMVKPASWWAKQGTNVGIKQANWKPTIGALHPHCICHLIRVPTGWTITEDGELEPPDEEKSISSDLQKARKLHYKTVFAGLPISIENRKGSYRRWKDPNNGEEGKTFMSLPYGYIRGTKGVDGDHVDCYLGPNQNAPMVYVVHQLKAPDFKNYDEDKVMLGFDSKSEAERAYLAHYNSPDFHGHIDEIPIETFRENVLSGKYVGKKITKSLAGQSYGGPAQNVSVGTGAWLVDQTKKIERIVDLTSLMNWMTDFVKRQRKHEKRRIIVNKNNLIPPIRPPAALANPPPPNIKRVEDVKAQLHDTAVRAKERLKVIREQQLPVKETNRKLMQWMP